MSWMARKPRKIRIKSVSAAEKIGARQAGLIVGKSNLFAEELHHVVRLLLICQTRTEREVVAVRWYQLRDVADTAAALDILPRRVAETLESLEARLTLAEQRAAVERRLQTILSPKKKTRCVHRLQPVKQLRKMAADTAEG